MKRRMYKVKVKWSPNFAYSIGLIATDGRHISFTTKDVELAHLFKKCLGIDNKIGKKARTYTKVKKYYVL